MSRPCPSCDGRGYQEWTSPPHRGDPRYRYNCLTCEGTGRVHSVVINEEQWAAHCERH
jgi:DnaJ-class molecular chaperone